LFITQVIYEREGPWWGDIDRETCESFTIALWQQLIHLVTYKEELSEEMMALAF
jgi:hypothetical protein